MTSDPRVSAISKEINFSCKRRSNKKGSEEGPEGAPKSKYAKVSEFQTSISFSNTSEQIPSQESQDNVPKEQEGQQLCGPSTSTINLEEEGSQLSISSSPVLKPLPTAISELDTSEVDSDISAVSTPLSSTSAGTAEVSSLRPENRPSHHQTSCLEDIALTNQQLLKEISQKVQLLEQQTSKLNMPPPPEICTKQVVHTVHGSTIDCIKKAKNLVQLLETPDLNFSDRHATEKSEGFVIKCETCSFYCQNAVIPDKVKKRPGSSFATGHIIEAKHHSIYEKGSSHSNLQERAQWHNFKASVLQHLSSALHSNAITYNESHIQQQRRDTKVTRTIVATVLTCVRAKLSAQNFPPMLSMLQSLGVDVGNIGQSRY